ncbi:MAG TPA: ABC transporter ATP-binding protein [Membranihabitans sp.]|nr:ABC transporter ATP-binding protein [Membranihabitans sp.]
MNQPPIIELSHLTKKYKNLTAVDRLDLSIYPGEVFGLLGPNGAGKSTTILMILGLSEPTAGRVRVCGIDSTTHPVEVKRKIGYLPDDVGFYDDRSGKFNLLYTARLNRIKDQVAYQRADRLLYQVGLSQVAEKKVGEYSRGMRQRLGLADVLIKDPEIIILDEPTLGIDPEGVREFLELIVRLSREHGITVLLSSHHLHQVQQVCDRVGIFVQGKLLAEGDIPSLSQKLFEGEPLIIEAGIGFPDRGNPADPLSNNHIGKLKDELLQLEGVGSVQYENDVFLIGCSRDICPDIARLVINSGGDLRRLSKREFGLNELYHRYFEDGKQDYNI